MSSPSPSPAVGAKVWRPLLVALLVGLISLAFRAPLLKSRPTTGRLNGGEPESHILVTEMAMAQTSWRIHHFLPIFNLGAPYDKFIDNHPGAESADELGNYYYTSTPPLTFVLPYVASLLSGGPTLLAQRWYNVALQAAAALLLAALVYRCGQGRGVEQDLRALAAGTVAIIYMTAPECLKSHSFTLWAQQWYAVLLPVQLYFFLFRPQPLLLGLLAAIGCLSDWTPYVANSAMAGIALYSWWRHRDRRALTVALAILLGCCVGGLTMIAWFTSKMTLHEYFTDLRTRSNDRSNGPLFDLLKFLPRYVNTFGVYLVLGAMALWARPWSAGWRKPSDRSPVILPELDPLVVAMLVTALALLEHILVKGHALIYSYDRLKGVQLLALLVAWAVYNAAPKVGWRLHRGALVAAFLSMGLFYFTYATPWGAYYLPITPTERVTEVMRRTQSPEGPTFYNADVRGAEVYYAGRNIHMFVQADAAKAGLNVPTYIRQWCVRHGFTEATLYELSNIELFPTRENLPRTVRVTRVSVNQDPVVLETVTLDERPQDYHLNKTFLDLDPIWKSPRIY